MYYFLLIFWQQGGMLQSFELRWPVHLFVCKWQGPVELNEYCRACDWRCLLSAVMQHSCRHRATGFWEDRKVFARSRLQKPCMFHLVILLAPPSILPGMIVLILVLNRWFANVCRWWSKVAPPSLGSWYILMWVKLYFSCRLYWIVCILLIW